MAEAKSYKIAVIPGDGIGLEVVPQGIRVLDAAGKRFGFSCTWQNFDWSCETYRRTGRMMPEDAPGSVAPVRRNFPGRRWSSRRTRPRIALGIADSHSPPFSQYVNLRPVRLLEGLDSPLKNALAGPD